MLVPGSVLSIASGVALGLGEGALVAGLGTWLGALGSFAVGRWLLRPRVTRWMKQHPRWPHFEEMTSDRGGLLVFLTRLSPIAPSTLMNYAFATVPIRPAAFALGSVGLIPNVVMYTYLGTLTGNALKAPEPTFASWPEWLLAAVWIVSSGVILGWLAKLIRKSTSDSSPMENER